MLGYTNLSLAFLIHTNIGFAEPKLIDLGHDLGHDTPYFINPGAEPFSYELIQTRYQGSWHVNGKYRTLEHMGTHVIAPYSFCEQGRTVDEIPVERYFGEASVIDVRKKVTAVDGHYEVSEQDISDWIQANGVFPNNSFVLINTGWDERYPDQKAYVGDDKGLLNNLKFPGLSLAAMQNILSLEATDGINIIGFGIDSPGFDIGGATSLDVTNLFTSLDKYGIRNMRNLKSLPPKGTKLVVAPIKIRNGAAAQARVFAQLP